MDRTQNLTDAAIQNAAGTRIPNTEQQAVIDELRENIILFASAGTGKTFTVARRVGRILSAGFAKPDEILCLTFTIKAASEMKEDISVHAGENAKSVEVSTIHSFCFRALREQYKTLNEAAADPMVCDDADEGEELKDILLAMGLHQSDENGRGIVRGSAGTPAGGFREYEEDDRRISVLHQPDYLTRFMSQLKHKREESDLFTEDEASDYQRAFEEVLEQQTAAKLFTFYDKKVRAEGIDQEFAALMRRQAGAFAATYDDILRQSNRLDFDDLVCILHRHWKKGEWLERWSTRYRYIFIDEMQDTSILEYDTLKRIFPGANVMMCGDFFQTIYEWRHSRPEEVLSSFIREFGARRFMFMENYRSTANLVNASFGYLKNTFPDLLGRYCPETIQIRSGETGDRITLVQAGSPEEEAAWIYRYLSGHRPEDPAKVCVMARTNPYIAALSEQLNKIAKAQPEAQRLRFFTVDRDFRFFKRPVIKDILAFFSILLNSSDVISMTRITEKYCHGVGAETIKKIRDHQTLGISLTSYLSPVYRRTGDPYDALIRGTAEGNIVIYDTETTGLDLEKDQILQISAIRIDRSGNITDQLNQLVIPTVEISAGALATHHKTYDEIVRNGGVGIDTALRRFSDFVRGAVLVGHNSLRFDAPLVRRQLEECGLPPLEIITEYDTMVIARQFIPESVNYKLDTLCGRFGIINDAAHDAFGDITATGRVLTRLIREYIMPRTSERVAFLRQYQAKFGKFSQFIDSLGELLARGELRAMAETIIRTLNPGKYYPSKSTAEALYDFVHSLPDGRVDYAVGYLRNYLNDAALSGSQMDLLIRKLNKIPIITVHQSKGCEFDTVIIAGADERNFPSYLSAKSGSEEEEKRVFYVAITRAKKKLILTFSNTNGFGKSVRYSPYLRGIPREYGMSISASSDLP